MQYSVEMIPEGRRRMPNRYQSLCADSQPNHLQKAGCLVSLPFARSEYVPLYLLENDHGSHDHEDLGSVRQRGHPAPEA